MKRLFFLLTLSVLLLLGNTAMVAASYPIYEREDYYGTWYFTSYVLEGESGTAKETNQHLTLVLKAKDVDAFVERYPDPKHPELKAYVRTTYQKPVADYIDGIFDTTEYDVPVEMIVRARPQGAESDFRQGTYLLLQRKHPSVQHHTYQLFLKDKETLVMHVEFPQDGGKAFYEYTFKRTDPFAG